MKFLSVIGTIALTILCWGAYGPVLHKGQHAMQYGPAGEEVPAMLLPFLLVGVAYFLIAVAVPTVLLNVRGEQGRWTATGTFWSLLAGAAGAIGALGIILAFTSNGRPVYVMPIVFGGAPIINSFVTMYMARLTKKIGPIFVAGLIMVILGAVTVLIFKPAPPSSGAATVADPSMAQWFWIICAITATVFTWGVYGPVLHKGQMKMDGSRLRPLICVGLAYFGIAVAVPTMLLSAGTDGGWSSFSWGGSFWSLSAGAAGALGALGIIMAFNFGGKPIYIMPLVFGGAPVVNTFISIFQHDQFSDVSSLFIAGLILVAAGAAIVLVFAPKGTAPATSAAKPEPKREDQPEASGPEDDSVGDDKNVPSDDPGLDDPPDSSSQA